MNSRLQNTKMSKKSQPLSVQGILMTVKVKGNVQTCRSEEVSETNVILIATGVSGLKLRVEGAGRMQAGYLVLQEEGGTAVNNNTKDVPKHYSII